jgi:hypothetical protein
VTTSAKEVALKKESNWRLFISVLLGFVTVAVLRFSVTLLPFGNLRIVVDDAATLPAMLITHFVYPDGMPAGPGAPHLGALLTVSEIIPYAIIWFAFLSWRNRRSQTAII